MAAPAKLEARDLAAILAVVVIWGINFVVMKVGLASFTPFQMGAGRYLFAFLPLAFLIRRPTAGMRWVVAFGAAQGIGQFGLLFVALKIGMTAALASVLLQTQVFFSAFMGSTLLRERIAPPLWAGMAFAAPGLACFAVSAWQARAAGAVTVWGLLLTLAAAGLWALSNIVVRYAQKADAAFDPLAFVVWCSAVPILPFLAMSWWFDPPAAQANWTKAPWTAWMSLAFLGWVATDLAYGLWTKLLKRFPASRVAPFSLGVPLIGLGAGICCWASGCWGCSGWGRGWCFVRWFAWWWVRRWDGTGEASRRLDPSEAINTMYVCASNGIPPRPR